MKSLAHTQTWNVIPVGHHYTHFACRRNNVQPKMSCHFHVNEIMVDPESNNVVTVEFSIFVSTCMHSGPCIHPASAYKKKIDWRHICMCDPKIWQWRLLGSLFFECVSC